MPAILNPDGSYDDPEDWDDEIPVELAERIAVELRALGWNVPEHGVSEAGVDVLAADGSDTGVWMARGGALFTGIGDHRGRCDNPVNVYADPRDPQAVARATDRQMRALGLTPLTEEVRASTALRGTIHDAQMLIRALSDRLADAEIARMRQLVDDRGTDEGAAAYANALIEDLHNEAQRVHDAVQRVVQHLTAGARSQHASEPGHGTAPEQR